VHWKVSARTQSLKIKEYDPSATLNLVLALDVQTTKRGYNYLPAVLEHLICAAASLTVRALEERHAVGLYANGHGTKGARWLRVDPGRRQLQGREILTSLARLEPFRGIPYTEMLGAMIGMLPYGTTVVALCATLDAPRIEALSALEDHGHSVTLLTPSEPEISHPFHTWRLKGLDA